MKDGTIQRVERGGRICSVEGCDGKHRARGYCDKHLVRWRVHGDPLVVKTAPGRVARSDDELWGIMLDRRVVSATGCWEYTGTLDSAGYGLISRQGKRRGAHRIAYQLKVGPIPDGLGVCHRCDNPPCFNPDHLFLGTQSDNLDDMRTKKRHYVKLTADDVRAIRASPERQRDLAARYGVSRQAIGAIKRRETWAHLPD